MQTRFHVTTPVVVKSAEEFAAIVQQNPIVPPDADHPRFLVAFAMDPAGIRGLHGLRMLLRGAEGC